MSVITLPRLLDAPLSLEVTRQQRIHKLAAMAADLIKNGTYADHGDAIMTLVACGYTPFEIFACVDDARQVATQHAVAMEMSE